LNALKVFRMFSLLSIPTISLLLSKWVPAFGESSI
jgi:hypothetical protein